MDKMVFIQVNWSVHKYGKYKKPAQIHTKVVWTGFTIHLNQPAKAGSGNLTVKFNLIFKKYLHYLPLKRRIG
jgi:hypothetical protein